MTIYMHEIYLDNEQPGTALSLEFENKPRRHKKDTSSPNINLLLQELESGIFSLNSSSLQSK